MIEQQQNTPRAIESRGVCYLQFGHFQQFPALIHGIFTRLGGHSQEPFASLNVAASKGDNVEHVLRNRLLVLRTLGLERRPCATLWQVHSADVAILDKEQWDDWRYDWEHRSYEVDGHELIWTRRPRRKADAIITNDSAVTLVMSFADCVPLLFYDPRQRVIAIAHAGWRGTARGVAITTVEAMSAHFGCRPADIRAGIAPAIGACCYEVSEYVRDLFYGRAEFEELPTAPRLRNWIAESAVFSLVERAGVAEKAASGPSLRLDLWETNRRQLLLAGLRAEYTETAGVCTCCDRERFFSHRGEHGQTGRFPVVMALRPPAISGEEAE